MRYCAVPVFDVSQANGEDLPSLAHELHGDADDDVVALDRFNRLESYALQSGFAVEVKHISGEANGSMNPSSRVLAIEQELPMLHRTKTLAHECEHMVLHADLDAKLAHNSRSQQEVEAESVAFCLLKAFGLDASLCSFAGSRPTGCPQPLRPTPRVAIVRFRCGRSRRVQRPGLSRVGRAIRSRWREAS